MSAPHADKGARPVDLNSPWVKHLGEFKTARSARDAVEQGHFLTLLKNASTHGAWLSKLEILELQRSTASRLMQSARRFQAAPPAFFDAVGSVSKLFELLALDTDMTDALAGGQAVHGLTLVAISTMSAVKMRAAVRKAMATARDADKAEVLPGGQAGHGLTLEEISPKPGDLSEDEARMLHLFRQCDAKTREALFLVAELQARP